MSAVYTVGTISVTNGSDIVTGTGTAWVGVIQTGWQIKLPNGEIYWVRQVISATQLQLENAYTGTSQSNQDYIAGPTGGIARALANKVQELIGDFQGVADNAGEGKFADGNLAQPGIRFIADEDTGFHRPSSNAISVVTGGVERARFTSTGLNSAPIGATTPSTGNFTSLTVNGVPVLASQAAGSFTWDASTASPAAVTAVDLPDFVREELHDKMRGCTVNSDGSVNYYLKATDWSQKENGSASTLTGADGNVMVEIPRFYFRQQRIGDLLKLEVSPVPLSGFSLHPAFIKDGLEVSYRYYSAYDACVFDGSSYIGGLNLDNNTGNVDLTASTGDKLASVKGQYPMVGLTRGEFRTLAANTGAPWRQLDFALWSAVQMLYLVENQTFFSQNVLGAGNTNGSYVSSSADQNDSPHTIAGAGDAIGSGSTDTTSGAGVSAKPGTSFMKYRGIENLYGNCWNWADGINVNVSATGNVHFTNDKASFADNTASGHILLTDSFPTSSDFIRDLLPTNGFFLSSLNSGAGSTTFITDRHFGSASSNRVVRVGGSANNGADAGAFALTSNDGSSSRLRNFGARLCL